MEEERKRYFTMLSKEFPTVLRELIETEPMQRLQFVGMHCGCELTKISVYKKRKHNWLGDRLIHSIGVALITWNFTHSEKQAVAALFHDIATPAFAHTVDVMNGDAEQQESTETNTRKIIAESSEIQRILKKHKLTTEEVCDYHKYSIADNDQPKLSADRLEYTLENSLNLLGIDFSTIEKLYNSITVVTNSSGEQELAFSSKKWAITYTKYALQLAKVYQCPAVHYFMYKLSELLKVLVNEGVDLMQPESEIVAKLETNPLTKEEWNQLTQLKQVKRTKHKVFSNSIKGAVKKRYVNPLFVWAGSEHRVSLYSEDVAIMIQEVLGEDMDVWLTPK